MKNLTLITIGILLSISVSAQMYEVVHETLIDSGEVVELEKGDDRISFTRIDSKFNGRGKARFILYNDNTKTVFRLKCKVIKSFYKEGANKEQFSFILEHETLGRIEYDTDAIGYDQKIYLAYDGLTEKFGSVLTLN